MWGEHTQIGLDPHKSSSLFQHDCAQRNIGRFFAPLVGSRLSNSSFVEGMWRHAGVSASKFAKVFRKAAEINENMWNYNQGMWTDTGVSAFKGIWKCSTPSLWPFPLWPSLTLMRKKCPSEKFVRPVFFLPIAWSSHFEDRYWNKRKIATVDQTGLAGRVLLHHHQHLPGALQLFSSFCSQCTADSAHRYFPIMLFWLPDTRCPQLTFWRQILNQMKWGQKISAISQ